MFPYRRRSDNVMVLRTPDSPSVRELMAPYDEKIRVEPYLYCTCTEALAKARRAVARAQDEARFRDENGWVRDWRVTDMTDHVDDPDERLLDWFAKAGGFKRDGEGNFLSTYDPRSRWNRYDVERVSSFRDWIGDSIDPAAEEECHREWQEMTEEERQNPRYADDEDLFVETSMVDFMWFESRNIMTPDGVWHTGWQEDPDEDWQMTTDDERDWYRHFRERFVFPYLNRVTEVVQVGYVTYNEPV